MEPRRVLDFPTFARLLFEDLDLDVNENDLTRDASLLEDLAIDSLGFLEILAFVCERGAEVDDEELAQKRTLGQVYDLYALHAALPR